MSIARVRGPGQPDQACDLVAAAIAEEYLRRDPASRLNLRISGGRGVLFAAGDVLSSADFDVSAVVRRALAAISVSASVEPFIAFEPMSATAAPSAGSRESVHVFGYATAETPSSLPRAVTLAREVAQTLEARRMNDADWFWLGSDYEVIADARSRPPQLIIRVEHVDKVDLKFVRESVEALVRGCVPDADVRVNIAGAEIDAGLAGRMGSSGLASAMDQYGALLPSHASGIGRHLAHPSQAGAGLVRSAARELVADGKGKAIMAQVLWLPLETKPSALRIRNERGEDLSALISRDRFDLARLPDAYRDPSLVMQIPRAGFDRSVRLPWEAA
jgi:S-adenosylmethionine synthetase